MTPIKTQKPPKSLLEAIRYFSDEDRAFEFFKQLRWPDGEVACPRCGEMDPYFLSTRHIWKCRGCRKQFSLKVGTIFEDSPIALDKWLPAVWLIANSKNSISSHELARALQVTQKTAWFMLHRIRFAMESETFEKLFGTSEIDETYVGGRGEFVHRRVLKLRGYPPKTPVQGVRNRDTGTVRAKVITGEGQLKANVHSWIEPGATVYTDEAQAYRTIGDTYIHDFVTHQGPTRNRYVRGDVHTNGIENFWALLKRAIKGTQVHVDRKHLDRYVTERVFAYNYRGETDLERMQRVLAGASGRRLTFDELAG
ncbi:MAG: IS1595 family transposase [Acidimicrobiales bacterium]